MPAAIQELVVKIKPNWRKRRKVEEMRVFKYGAIFLWLFLQTSLCFARSDNVINFSVAPDPLTHCHQYGIDVAVTEKSTLGVIPANCTDRPTFGLINSQVTNKFSRVLFQWRYSPQGAFKTGSFWDVMVGEETSEFKSAAGSTANVTYIDTAIHFGYQWFWRNGLNVSALCGIGHLMPYRLEKNIATTESATVSDYLDQQTSTTTHVGAGVALGWAF